MKMRSSFIGWTMTYQVAVVTYKWTKVVSFPYENSGYFYGLFGKLIVMFFITYDEKIIMY